MKAIHLIVKGSPQKLLRARRIPTWFKVSVHDAEGEIGAISMDGERNADKRAEVVHVKEVGAVVVIVAADQQVHVVRCLQQCTCQIISDSFHYSFGYQNQEIDIVIL